MPRVVPDQKTKFETDELFKKLSQDVDVSLRRVQQLLFVSCFSLVLLMSANSAFSAGEVHWVQGEASGGEEKKVCGGSS